MELLGIILISVLILFAFIFADKIGSDLFLKYKEKIPEGGLIGWIWRKFFNKNNP